MKKKGTPKYVPLGLKTLLPYVATWITGHSRAPVFEEKDFEWSRRSWTHNAFRLYELIFWRRVGIRPEISSHAWVDESGKKHVSYAAHSWEGAFALTEQHIRSFLESFKFARVKIYIPVLSAPQGLPLFLSPYLFAIAYDIDTHGADNTANVTWTHTCTGSNLMLQELTQLQQASDALDAPTYNSVSMTLITKKINGGSNMWAYAHYLINPATGANTMHISDGGASTIKRGQSISYSGAAQTGQPDASNNANGSNANTHASTTVTVVAANSWVTGMYISNTSVDPTINSYYGTLRYTPGSVLALLDSNGPVSAGGYEIGENTSGGTGVSWAVVGFSFSPAAPPFMTAPFKIARQAPQRAASW